MSNAQHQVSELTEIRASIIWWFSTLLTQEMDEEQLATYCNGQGDRLLEQLAEQPELTEPIRQLQQALSELNRNQHPQLELAADFCQLFLCDSKSGAPPYASVYLASNGMLFQEPHEEMLRLLHDHGLTLRQSFNEPADHIAIQLDYLGNLILRDGDEPSHEQSEFILNHLLNWLPLWYQACVKVRNSGVYQSVIQLLCQYLHTELTHMQPEA